MDFPWTEKTELAAELIAAGNLTLEEIASRVGVNRRTLWEWKKNEAFAGRIEARLEELRAEVRRIGLATIERRVQAQNDRWFKMRQVIEARAEDPAMQDVPGGTTGLLVRTVKGIGSGDDFRVVEEFAVDTGLLRELREIEKQAGQELGQWTEKRDVTGAVAVAAELGVLPSLPPGAAKAMLKTFHEFKTKGEPTGEGPGDA